MSNKSFCSRSEFKLYLSIFLTFLALIFTWFAAFDCSFFTVSLPVSTSKTYSFGFGLWMVQTVPTEAQALAGTPTACQLWNSAGALKNGIDSSFRFARAVSMITLIISLPVAAFSSAMLFLHSVKRTFVYSLGIAMLLLTFLTLLEFVALDSRLCRDQLDCNLSVSGAYAIVATCLWFVSAIFVFFVDTAEDRPKQVRPVIEVPPAADVPAKAPVSVEERTTLADGSTKITTTTTYPDGRKTVKEVIETEEEGKLEEVPLEDL